MGIAVSHPLLPITTLRDRAAVRLDDGHLRAIGRENREPLAASWDGSPGIALFHQLRQVSMASARSDGSRGLCCALTEAGFLESEPATT